MIEITDKEFSQFSVYIKRNYGINLKTEKKLMFSGRLQNVLTDIGCESFSDYYEYVRSDSSGQAAITLIDKVTTNHTFFMREADHFTFFQEKVLPYLKRSVQSKDLRIWCAASSSGEEAYTLAMILDEYFGAEKLLWDKKILATDISESVLDVATRGIYSNDRIKPLPTQWKQKYLKKYDSENWVIHNSIKNEVIFRKFNLMEGFFPFRKKFNVIFCRNVLIYFDSETKDQLIQKFYDALEVGGYLFLGHSETINRFGSCFDYVMPSVYRKNRTT